VAGCVSLWLVLDRCGSFWVIVGSLLGRCVSLYVVVGRCGVVVGSLWVVASFSNYDVRIIYGNVRICIASAS
jgi:hypothetical protein